MKRGRMHWRRMDWRTGLVLLNTCIIMVVIAATFWQQDWQYSLPTPKPAGLKQPALGQPISVGALALTPKQPVLLHFFSPDCPCSRFNLEHVRDLVRRFSGRVRFVAVLEGDSDPVLLRAAFDRLHLGMESVLDTGGEIGRATGVYATPQAVLLDRAGRLYYRGNYNVSRYCSRPETEFARLALESLLGGRRSPPETPAASTAYGCPRRSRQAGNRAI